MLTLQHVGALFKRAQIQQKFQMMKKGRDPKGTDQFFDTSFVLYDDWSVAMQSPDPIKSQSPQKYFNNCIFLA